MTPTARNPDVFHDKDEPIPDSLIPPGCYLHHGLHLQMTARSAKIPFGEAKKRTYDGSASKSRKETIGLIIRLEDRERFAQALANRNSKKKHQTV